MSTADSNSPGGGPLDPNVAGLLAASKDESLRKADTARRTLGASLRKHAFETGLVANARTA